MHALPELRISIGKIRENAKRVVDLCSRKGIGIWGVSKGLSGLPEVARAMLEGDVLV